jgi:acetyl esterase/lipase
MTQTMYGSMFVVVVLAVPLRAQDVVATRDIVYGTDAMQRLDIYQPRGAKGKLPTVLWIHGGGWVEGDKRNGPNGISVLAPLLVEKGFVAVSCNYRLAPKHRHPAQVDDVQRAVRWLRAHAEAYHIDPDRIGAVGISAGGHLAFVLAVRETRAKQNDDLDTFSSKVQAAVSLNGATDLREDPELRTPAVATAIRNLVGDDPEQARKAREDASPILFVGKDAAPTLFIVGTKDTLVLNAHSRRGVDALKRHKVDAELLVLEGAGHAIFPSITPRAKEAILEWLGKKLKP